MAQGLLFSLASIETKEFSNPEKKSKNNNQGTQTVYGHEKLINRWKMMITDIKSDKVSTEK
ncbi:hypothetical protein K6V78_02415 [Streptococcus gallolyticus]|nr:hypothetical protein [Streptococcus gallolyticus]MBY5040493.1 hypothetical protein [Streptococcus gallolyticus]